MRGCWFTKVTLIVLALVLAFGASCAREGAKTSDKIVVAVSILPQVEFVEEVGGDKVDVIVMVPSGASPHTYEPTPSQMTGLSQARMYTKVGSGIEFELIWMDDLIALNEDMLVIDCSQGVKLQEVAGAHGQEVEGDHEHGMMDPHIWMSPRNAQIMVQNICSGLIQIDPDNWVYYERNRDVYLEKLDQLDQDIQDGLSEVPSRVFMVYHPALGYFARDYNLTMIAIEEEGKEPTPAGLAYLIEQAKEQNIEAIFASSRSNPQGAQVIADAIGGRVVFVDVLARDYLVNLRILLDELVPAME